MTKKFSFDSQEFDIVFANLSIHFFSCEDTLKLLKEIYRILKPNGYLLFRVNSINSTEFKKLLDSGEKEIEPHLFFNKNMEKRFFSEEDIKKFFEEWEFICIREENMDRWCSDKIIWKCAVKKTN